MPKNTDHDCLASFCLYKRTTTLNRELQSKLRKTELLSIVKQKKLQHRVPIGKDVEIKHDMKVTILKLSSKLAYTI